MPALGRYFLDAIHPFVWRRSLDYGAIGEIRAISRRIRDHYAQGQALGPGYDLKRGRGGIREVEFFVQIHQLIHGGREPELRAPATLDALAALEQAGPDRGRTTPPSLRDAYPLAADDRAPAADGRRPPDPQPARRAGGARQCRRGCTASPTAPRCSRLLRPARRARRGALRHARRRRGRPPVRESAGAGRALAEAGFAEPGAARGRIEGWRSGKVRGAAHRARPARPSRRCCRS